jgi:hypothetical protein
MVALMAMLWALQDSRPFVVVPIPAPTHQASLADVVLGAVGLTGVLILASLLLGAALAFGLMLWNRRHPPEDDRLPSISPLVPDPHRHESSQAQ